MSADRIEQALCRWAEARYHLIAVREVEFVQSIVGSYMLVNIRTDGGVHQREATYATPLIKDILRFMDQGNEAPTEKMGLADPNESPFEMPEGYYGPP